MSIAASHVRLANGTTLSYGSTGESSDAAVLFLPGPTDSWHSYEPVLELLPASTHAIALSQRGHGDSDKPASGYRVEDFAIDVPLFLDALSVERAVLVGHSGSCLVARRVAIDHPERVAGLVLEASPTSLIGHAGLQAFVEDTATLQDPIDPDFARSFIADTSSDELPPELLGQLTSELLKVPARAWKEMFGALLTYDDTAEIGRITAPTLLVWGDADGLVDRRMQKMLADGIPDATLVVYTGVGHTPRWEVPVRFASDVATFVDNCHRGLSASSLRTS